MERGRDSSVLGDSSDVAGGWGGGGDGKSRSKISTGQRGLETER